MTLCTLPQQLRALEDGDKATELENFVDRELRSFSREEPAFVIVQ